MRSHGPWFYLARTREQRKKRYTHTHTEQGGKKQQRSIVDWSACRLCRYHKSVFAIHTSWLRRLAAPRPVGPAPMTRVSTSVVDMAMLWLEGKKKFPTWWGEGDGGWRDGGGKKGKGGSTQTEMKDLSGVGPSWQQWSKRARAANFVGTQVRETKWPSTPSASFSRLCDSPIRTHTQTHTHKCTQTHVWSWPRLGASGDGRLTGLQGKNRQRLCTTLHQGQLRPLTQQEQQRRQKAGMQVSRQISGSRSL